MSLSTSAEASPADDAVVEEAAGWLIRLSDDATKAEDYAAFESWKQSDPRRAEAAVRMSALIERLQSLRKTGDARALHATLDAVDGYRKKRSNFRRLGTTLTLILSVAVPGWLALQNYPPAYLLADVRSATGQLETQQLVDHTQLTLKGGSGVNLHFDDKQRMVELVRGEILLDVARDPQRPFVVETRQGSIRALGTRFAVRCDDDGTVLTMLESKTAVRTASTPGDQTKSELVVSAGQRVRLSADGFGTVESIDAESIADAWRFNQLVVQDAALPDVLDELARQQKGILRYDRAALTNIRVSAVLPLGDIDQALRLLSASHHLQITRMTPWLVSVSLASKP